jgi:dsDNA-specific endonuclease/ATPase MutS2
VRPTLDAVRVPGAVAEGAALAAMLPLLDAAARLTGYGRGIREAAPDLAAAFADFPSPKPLAELLRRALEEDGSVKDEASPALRRIRSRLRDLRKDIVRTLEAYFQSPAADTIFQERYVTVRHGRFVLPVAAGAKSRCAASSTTDRRAAPRSSSSRKAWWRRTMNWCRRSARRKARSCECSPR